MAGAEIDVDGFELGELVMAKFSRWPHWPAVVRKCVKKEKRYRGAWRLASTSGAPAKVWCCFVDDNAGNWVPVSKVEKFNPRTVHQWQCQNGARNYAAQQAAIAIADEMFRSRGAFGHDDSDRSGATRSMERGSGSGRSGAEIFSKSDISDSDSIANSSAPDSSRGSNSEDAQDYPGENISEGHTDYSKRSLDSSASKVVVIERSSDPIAPYLRRKRQRSEARDEDESSQAEDLKWRMSQIASGNIKFYAKSENLREEKSVIKDAGEVEKLRDAIKEKNKLLKTVSTMKAALEDHLQTRDNWLKDFKLRSAFADIPELPRHSTAVLPPEHTYQSKPMSCKEIGEAIQQLRACFSRFAKRLETCEALRNECETRIGESRENIAQACADIAECGLLAENDHDLIIHTLMRLVAAKVDLSDLRKTRAGKVVTKMMSGCVGVPQIRFLCSKLVELWKEQCRLFDECCTQSKE